MWRDFGKTPLYSLIITATNSGAVLSSAIQHFFLCRLTIFGILLSLTFEISMVWIFLLEIVQFRVRYDR